MGIGRVVRSLFLGTLACLAAEGLENKVQANDFQETRITYDSSVQNRPRVDGNQVAWDDYREVDSFVHYFTAENGERKFAIPSRYAFSNLIDFRNNQIGILAAIDSNSSPDVWLTSLESGSISTFNENSLIGSNSVFNDQDIETITNQLTNILGAQECYVNSWSLYNDRIALNVGYTSNGYDFYHSVFLWNDTNHIDEIYKHDDNVSRVIAGKNTIWSISSGKILEWVGDENKVILDDMPESLTSSGDSLVYFRNVDGFNQIFSCNSTYGERQLTFSPSIKSQLDAYNGGIAWTDYRNNNYDIYMMTIPDPSTTFLFGLGALALLTQRKQINKDSNH